MYLLNKYGNNIYDNLLFSYFLLSFMKFLKFFKNLNSCFITNFSNTLYKKFKKLMTN